MSTRGYFGIGVQQISKEQNVGTLARSAYSFGAGFFFAIAPDVDIEAMRTTDTADSFNHMPYYQYDSVADLRLPKRCALVAVELTDDAIELPSFRHPTRAAYILGPEMGNVSQDILDIADHVIKIPMRYCVNVGVAGALVMYDRMVSMGIRAPRPVKAGGPTEDFVKPKSNIRRKVRKKN